MLENGVLFIGEIGFFIYLNVRLLFSSHTLMSLNLIIISYILFNNYTQVKFIFLS